MIRTSGIPMMEDVILKLHLQWTTFCWN